MQGALEKFRPTTRILTRIKGEEKARFFIYNLLNILLHMEYGTIIVSLFRP